MRRIKAEIIVISLLWIYTIQSLLSVEYMDIQLIIGITGLVLSTVLAARFPKTTFYLLSFLLLFSIFKLVKFSQTNYYAGFNGLHINIIPTVLLAYLCFKRRKIIRQWFAADDKESVKEEIQKRKTSIFKKEFQDYSLHEIEKKLEASDLVSEARNALLELRDERQNK